MNWKKFRIQISFGMALLITLSFALPVQAAGPTSTGEKVDLKSNSPQIMAVKVDPKVQKQFETDQYVTFLVKMKEQADPQVAAHKARQQATADKVTPSAAKLAMRNSVVSTLRETASRTQYNLELYLKKAKGKGEVKDYKSFFIVNSMAITSTKEAMEQIAQLPEVDKILPNQERFLDKVEKSQASSFTTAGAQPSSVEWNIAQVHAPEVWAMGIDGTGIVVANLDTGVEYSHPALNRKWRGLDALGNVSHPELSWYDAHSHSPLPADGHGHGTHTMGTMVGSEADGVNQIGVAPGAKWIAVRIFNPSTTDAIILDAGQWLLAPVDSEGNLHPELAPDVVNNSWGGGPGIDEWFRPIVQAWRAAQIFPEFSAGNVTATNPGGPGSVANPANYPESFSTGAIDINGNLANFSLQGPSPYGEMKPEVSAPGVNVRSSVPGGYEGGWNGTSMAGPHTTATAALLLQANHSLTVDQLEQIITTTATPRTDGQFPEAPNNGYGYGLVNAFNAVGSVISGIGTVTGKVTTSGDDDEPPVLDHTPLAVVYTGFDVPLTAHVTDNVGVTAVEAFAKIVGTDQYVYLPMERISGDAKDGMYQTSLPAFLLDSAGLEYYIRVNDYGNNGFESPKYRVIVSNGVQPGYMQDFETNFDGFSTGGDHNTWEWGIPTSGPGSAASGQKLAGTNLDGPYDPNSNAYLLAPPIDLSAGTQGVALSFKHWFDLETGFDSGVVYIASEDNNFTFVPKMQFTGSSQGWKTQFIDLNEYAGQRIYVLFNLFSDGSVQRAGWYIDDLTVLAPDSTPPAVPANLTASSDPTGNVVLGWSPSADADFKQYAVYRSTLPGAGYDLLGTTTATVYTDSTVADGTTYYYTVAAQDYSGNESGKSNEVSITVQRSIPIFSDNFDGSTDNGWIHQGTNDVWERGAPASPGPTNAVTPPNVWGTDLDGNYLSGSNFSLESPTIDLTAASTAVLTFDHWYSFETGWDFGRVEITSNGGSSWTELGKFSHVSNGMQWTPVFFDLAPYAGQQIKVRFRVTSDNSVVKAGWYIDNFQVLPTTAPATTPDVLPDFGETAKPKPIYGDLLFKLTKTGKDNFIEKKPTGDVVLQSLPVGASVTVVETGVSTQSDMSTGQYSFMHVAGDYHLKAETYGYYPQTAPVTITDNAAVTANFKLQPIPHGRVAGVVTDERSHEPIANATVFVMEDARITPVRTGADGAFTLDVLEGTYTVAVSAPDYYNKSVTVTVPPNESVEANVALKPFVGFAGDIGYDDGTAENARAFNAANNAWAVRMTPQAGTAQVTGASLRFWNTEWPQPGGTAFQYAVFDASGAGGAPGRMLAGPFDGTALRNGQWTSVSLADPVVVQGDFYIVYIQTAAYPNTPGLGTDEDGTNAERSWQRVGGVWGQSPLDEGNYMIRAIVRYPVNAPVIASPAPNSFTNQTSITVTGSSPANGATVNIYNGTELAGSGTVAEGQFSIPVSLQPGQNQLTAEAVVNGKSTDRSEPVIVTLDQTVPELTVTAPADGFKTNVEMVYVEGSASDEHLGEITVNNEQVNLRADGTFSHRILVNEGDNFITVTAKDRAGNETTVTRSVVVVLDLPEITNISPASDVHITAGGTLQVSFDSAPGLHGSFRVELPLAPSAAGSNEVLMTETSSGHYEGTYTTPESLVVNGGVIVIRVRDDAGNEVEVQAPGKLYVSGQPKPPSNADPVAVITAPGSAKPKKPVTFDGSLSGDVDGTIASYEWRFSDGGTASGASVNHTFSRAGSYSVTLTVTDNAGATNSITHTIVVK
ncbi:serine protease [Cohnella kolymensis]|uniref:Serine protease n=1 Tax=Cohnella kolymensis TaxID=1590652 RepID=A0ABR5A341_9BACL|nr:S8 family serine peptidase [Cohnella kolymensis]KIL35108.1 serine protease [Cohnella kolymensis]KIL36517.1 serine protease [Cohnella kolymensis]